LRQGSARNVRRLMIWMRTQRAPWNERAERKGGCGKKDKKPLWFPRKSKWVVGRAKAWSCVLLE
jgi:hypothetical protein